MPRVTKKIKPVNKLEKFSPEKISSEEIETEEISTSEQIAIDTEGSEASETSPNPHDLISEKDVDEEANQNEPTDNEVKTLKNTINFYAIRLP